MFKIGQVVAFKLYGNKRFPKATQYHLITKIEGKGAFAKVFTEDCKPICRGVINFFLAEDLRKLKKRERGE
jgi:hypothetical protein